MHTCVTLNHVASVHVCVCLHVDMDEGEGLKPGYSLQLHSSADLSD